ncbi:unnamed protein product [Prorocentrum cordatum]|uniref:Uncharacterized protein n=1 Tax=Prorocentrum cordatum TaxID=2364126 RepID=A0ABN9S8W1_9DINO|nr:unnamed protein product [Polarella glacialis]
MFCSRDNALNPTIPGVNILGLQGAIPSLRGKIGSLKGWIISFTAKTFNSCVHSALGPPPRRCPRESPRGRSWSGRVLARQKSRRPAVTEVQPPHNAPAPTPTSSRSWSGRVLTRQG